jgi:chromosome partitioning protein
VISGTQTLVISGTRSSWFQEPESALSICADNEIGAPNLSNIESFGFLLTDHARFHPVWKSPKTTRTTVTAVLNQTGDVGKTTVALDPVGGWSRQRLRVIAVDAGRKGENENCWLRWSKQRTKEGLTRLFEVIDLAPDAQRCEALEIACTVDHVVTDGLPCFAERTRSALFAIDVALTPFQPSPSPGEGASVEIRKLLKKALSFGNQLRTSFVLNRYRPRALIAPERAEVLAERDPSTPCNRVCQRVAFANVACSSQFAWKRRRNAHAARENDRARCRNHERRTVTAWDRKPVFAVAQSDLEVRSHNPEDRAVERAAKAVLFTARMTINVTPELRGHSEVTAFQRGLRVAEMPRDLRANFVKCHGAWFDE